MEVTIRQRTGDKCNNVVLTKAARYFMSTLLSYDQIPAVLDITLLKTLTNMGESRYDDTERIAYVRLAQSISFLEQLNTLAHECIHIKQFVTKQLTAENQMWCWNGTLYTEEDCLNESGYLVPWELEAEALQYQLSLNFLNQWYFQEHMTMQNYYATIN